MTPRRLAIAGLAACLVARPASRPVGGDTRNPRVEHAPRPDFSNLNDVVFQGPPKGGGRRTPGGRPR
jgi:hypothetical protein